MRVFYMKRSPPQPRTIFDHRKFVAFDRCCCAEEFCVMGAADTTPLDDSFCLAPADLCMENKWTLWCFFGGILLAMISIVLLVNSVALHHKVHKERNARGLVNTYFPRRSNDSEHFQLLMFAHEHDENCCAPHAMHASKLFSIPLFVGA